MLPFDETLVEIGLFFLERNELKQKEREVIVYIYSVLLVSSRGTMQKQLAAE